MKGYRTFRSALTREFVPRRTGKALLACFAVGALLAIGFGWCLARNGPRTAAALPHMRPVPAADHGELPERLDEPPAPREPVTRVDSAQADDAQHAAPDQRGAGTLTVRARLANGSAPEAWVLDLEDVGLLARDPEGARTSVRVEGGEIAIERRIDALHLLRGRAVGLASRAHGVTLVSGRSSAVVELVLEPAAVVEGRVVDAEDGAVAARDVWVTPWFDSTEPGEPSMPMHARTTPTGEFRLSDVRPGTWYVAVGERESPLVRSAEVVVTLPVTRVETIRLPALFTLALRVEDEHGIAVADARLWSRGANGGAFDVATDAYGEARISELPAGRWRVFAQSPSRGRANVVIELPREHADQVVVLKVLH